MNARDPQRGQEEAARQLADLASYQSALARWTGLVATAPTPFEAFRHAGWKPTTRDVATRIQGTGLRRAAEREVERVLERHVDAIPGDHPQMSDFLQQTQWAWPNIRLKLLEKAGLRACPLVEERHADLDDDSVERLVAEIMASLVDEGRAAA